MKTDSGSPVSKPEQVKSVWQRVFGFPGTQTGKWSSWLMLVSILFFVLIQLLIAFEQRESILFLVVGLALPLFAFGAGILAGIAIFRHGERSVISFAVLLLGMFIGSLLLFELTIPH